MIKLWKRRIRSSQEGVTIVEVLVALGILGVVAVGLGRLMNNSMTAQRSVELRSDVEDLRRFIQTNLSCAKTFDSFPSRPVNCSGNIALRRENGSIIVASGGQALGNWTLTARCENIGGQSGLSIYATRPAPGGGFLLDPLTRRPYDTNHPTSALYAPAVRPCGSFFTAAGSACPSGQALLAWAGTSPICLPDSCGPNQREVARIGNVPTCVNVGAPRSPIIVQNQMTASGVPYPADLSVSCPSGTILRACFGYMNNCPDADICNYLGAFASGNSCTARFDPDDGGGSILYVQAVCGYAE
jgi:hypothetical protein